MSHSLRTPGVGFYTDAKRAQDMASDLDPCSNQVLMFTSTGNTVVSVFLSAAE